MPDPVQLKIPIIGNLKSSLKLINVFKDNDDSQMEVEKALGESFEKTGHLNDILDFLFPIDVKDVLDKENWESALFTYSLLLKNHRIDPGKGNKNHRSAWANLMYDLGEFNLDGTSIYNIDDIIPHIYKSKNDWYVWWLDILEAEKTIKAIWNRITGKEVQVIFVDDDTKFADIFLGGKQKLEFLTIEIEEKWHLNKDCIDHSLIWIKPNPPYQEHNVKKQIEYIINQSKNDLLVFVIDLIFKKGKESNVIKGGELIKHLRGIKRNALIVAITGGTSPFIINSAEKAGADIVIFKERGGKSTHHGGSKGNAIGIFDLLWAISWNISVWKLLEKYKKKHLANGGVFKNYAHYFFSDFENISPFWKSYLNKWKTQINEAKIKRFFKEKHDIDL